MFTIQADPVASLFGIDDVRVGRVYDGHRDGLNVAGAIDERLKEIETAWTQAGQQDAMHVGLFDALFFDELFEIRLQLTQLALIEHEVDAQCDAIQKHQVFVVLFVSFKKFSNLLSFTNNQSKNPLYQYFNERVLSIDEKIEESTQIGTIEMFDELVALLENWLAERVLVEVRR